MFSVCKQERPRPRSSRRSPPGFSLIELTVVLLLLGIVAAVAQPKFSETLSRYRVEGAAARLQSDLVYARTLARVRSRTTTVRFFLAGSQGGSAYRLEQVPDPTVAASRFSPDDAASWYRVRLDEEPYRVALQAAPASVTFDHHGRPHAPAVIRLGIGARTRQLKVIAGSGEVVIQ